jgi:hypothetical protein
VDVRTELAPNQDKLLRLLCVILMFLSPPEPPETRTLTSTRTTILVVLLTPQHLASFTMPLI